MPRDMFHGISEQAKAGTHRYVDAQALLAACRWRGAMYLGGYAIECALKTKLMRMFDCRTLRDLEVELQRRGLLVGAETIYRHQLEPLLRLTGARTRLFADAEAFKAFKSVNRWIPAWRYAAVHTVKAEAEGFLTAVGIVLLWIEFNI